MRIDLERRPLVAALRQELRHELSALRGHWFWSVILNPDRVETRSFRLGGIRIGSGGERSNS